MGNYVSEQLALFLQSIALGAVLGLIYDLLGVLRSLGGRLWGGVLDALFCLTAACAVFLFVMAGDGELRIFIILGIVGGAVLFWCLLGGLLRPIWRFWLGLMLMLVFAVNLGWLPASGFYGPSYWILPSVAIATIPISTITRTTRSAMLEVIRQDYMRTARAKGLGEGAVILRHGLKNTLIPVITVIGIQLGRTLAGSIVVENIFSVPGLGSLIVNAIYARNYPIIQGAILFCALTFCLINLMVDILYAYIDPRIKSQYVRPKARKRAPAEAAAGAGKEG